MSEQLPAEIRSGNRPLTTAELPAGRVSGGDTRAYHRLAR
jgi:hypothetical protein